MSTLKRVAYAIDKANDWLGRGLSWLTLGVVMVTFAVVMMRYVFGLGSTIAQEVIVYLHATVFMAAAGYTLVHNGHVRCDIYYGDTSPRSRAIIDLVCTFVFLVPTCVLIIWVGWPYAKASWAVLEGSQEGRMGIPAVFLLKSLVVVFAAVLAVQAVSLVLQSALFLAGATDSRGAVDGAGDPSA